MKNAAGQKVKISCSDPHLTTLWPDFSVGKMRKLLFISGLLVIPACMHRPEPLVPVSASPNATVQAIAPSADWPWPALFDTNGVLPDSDWRVPMLAPPTAEDARQVFLDVGVADVVDQRAIAWTSDQERVIVAGRSGTNQVVLVAYRSDQPLTNLWLLERRQYLMKDRCCWVLGRLYLDHLPARSDVDFLLTNLYDSRAHPAFVFAEDLQ
jgi:hypothetical protein